MAPKNPIGPPCAGAAPESLRLVFEVVGPVFPVIVLTMLLIPKMEIKKLNKAYRIKPES